MQKRAEHYVPHVPHTERKTERENAAPSSTYKNKMMGGA